MSVRTKEKRRVVVTGLGVVSPLGNTIDEFWQSLTAGRGGVRSLAECGVEMAAGIGAPARKFSGTITDFSELKPERKKAIRKGLKVMCRETQMGVAAAQCALADAGLSENSYDPEQSGIVFGSDYMLSEPRDVADAFRNCIGKDGAFEFQRWSSEGMGEMTPLWLLRYLPNMPACHIAIYNDLRGPNNSLTLRETSANQAIGEAMRTIQRGSANMMVAGATGTRLHLVRWVQTVLQEELTDSDDPSSASRPFDRDRSGAVLGEGAGVLILEELSMAKARGAKIYAEIIGAGSSVVADGRGVANREFALVNAMRATMRDADVAPSDIGHLHAHGLSSRSCDIDEARAIKEVFGSPENQPPVTAAKSYFGNLGAGGGAVELAASILALDRGGWFPSLTYEVPDPECPVAIATAPDTSPGRSALNLNVTQQGQASAVLVRTL